MLNPVLKKEIRTSTRTWKTPLLVMIYVGILMSIMTFVFWVQSINIYNSNIEPKFIRDLFVGLAYLQLFLVLLISPSMTTAAISGERQRSTLDVLLVTRLSAKAIIIGKVYAGLYKVFMLIVASIPVFSVIYMFGGIGIIDLVFFIAICMMSAFLMGSIGVLMSTVFRKTPAASAITYGILLFLTIGVMMLTGATYLIMDNYAASTDFAYFFMYLHPFAPLSIFMDLNLGLGMNFIRFGSQSSNDIVDLFVTLGIQLSISIGCILLAARRINPIRKSKK